MLQNLGTAAVRIESSAPTPAIVLIRYSAANGDRLLVVNLGDDHLSPMNDALFAPPKDGGWTLLWSSEHPQYGGGGTMPFVEAGRWLIRGQSAFLLAGKT